MDIRKIGAGSLGRLIGGWQSGSARTPAYRQLEQALRLLILDGRLPIGTRLPGERILAEALGVSRTTIAASYAELRVQGFLASRHGSGSVTCLPHRLPSPANDLPATEGIDFSIAAMPAPKEVHSAYAEALEQLPRHLPGTGYDPAGLPELRAAIAEHYRRRGLPTDPEQILVTQGAQQGLVMALGLLARPGDRVVVDHPTYSKALEAIRNASCTPVPLPLTEKGWDLDQLSSTIGQASPSFAYLIPDFHNPTGHCLDEEGRERLAGLAADRGCHLVVDETMAELWLDSRPPMPVAAYDRAGKVISLGSMGKSCWGGLRIGWVRARRDLVAALGASRAAVDMGSPIVEQLAATILLRDPSAMLDRRRDEVRARRDHLLALVADRLPDWRVRTPSGGLSAWAELPRPVATALAAAAYRHGVRLAPGSRFGIDGAFERFVRLPYALPVATLTGVVDRLVKAWADVEAGPARTVATNPPQALTAAM
jgi:DNA-binding transcriptional MocR family regulator